MHPLVLAALQRPGVRRALVRWPAGLGLAAMAPCACGTLLLLSPTPYTEPAGAAPCAPAVDVSGVEGGQWSAEQLSNAAAIVATGIEMGVPARGLVVALATAMQESTLINVGHGDQAGPDSRGLFQQRDSWGPLHVRMDPAGAARLFYDRLLGVAGWEGMPVWQAAQTVQRSAFPRHYEKWEPEATRLAGELAGVNPAVGCDTQGTIDGWALPLPAEFVVPPMAEHHSYPAVDIGVAVGTPVYAITGGTVSLVDDGRCGLGVTLIDAAGGEWLYCHATTVTVSPGPVAAGVEVMLSGGAPGARGSGSSTGPHLHLQYRSGGSLRCINGVIDGLAAGQAPGDLSGLPAGYPCGAPS